MAYNNSIHLFPAIIALLLASMHMLALASTAPPPAAVGDCSDTIVAFSPCLPYISSPPNNVASSVSSECCDVFSLAFAKGTAECLCYLVRQPLILGFPLNSTRLFSLSSLCPLTNVRSKANGSLESLCSGLSPLPPLQDIIIGSVNSLPHNSVDASPATQSSSTTAPSPLLTPYTVSSAAKQINRSNWFPFGMVIFLVPIFTNLYTHH